jgi:DNA primase
MDKSDIERLNQLPIIEVANKLGLKLDRSNKCHCFIHEERTPSFSIHSRKNRWKCFGCGESGGVIKLVEKYNKCDFNGACKWLSNAFNITGSYHIVVPPKREIKIKPSTDNKPDSEVYKWFIENLSVTENVRQFIRNRKYPDDIIEKYNLKGLDDCNLYFNKCLAKWGIERLLKCGLAKETVTKETGEIKRRFTWWTSTLFFPFYDDNGNIVYIQGRTLNLEKEKRWKYVNLNEVGTFLFNQQILKTLKTNDPLVITEGVTDCISCCLMGKNAVGVIGAQGFKKEYVKLLSDFSIKVIPDNDKNGTGDKFASKIREEFQSIGKTIQIHHLGELYKDISEYYMKGWKHEYINRTNN